jgi:hypothetical protein
VGGTILNLDGSGTCFEVDWRVLMLERMGSLTRLSVEAILSVSASASAYGVHSQEEVEVEDPSYLKKIRSICFFTGDKVFMFTNYIHLFIFSLFIFFKFNFFF